MSEDINIHEKINYIESIVNRASEKAKKLGKGTESFLDYLGIIKDKDVEIKEYLYKIFYRDNEIIISDNFHHQNIVGVILLTTSKYLSTFKTDFIYDASRIYFPFINNTENPCKSDDDTHSVALFFYTMCHAMLARYHQFVCEEYDKALEIYNWCINLPNNSQSFLGLYPMILEGIGDIYIKLNQLDVAIDYYNQASNEYAENEDFSLQDKILIKIEYVQNNYSNQDFLKNFKYVEIEY